MLFSIVVVALNPGEKLNQTLDSILCQTYGDYEVIVKDGGSTDGSLQTMRRDGRIRLYEEKDGGIYDAMNQAVSHAQGEYLLFLNCGDVFRDAEVLKHAAVFIAKTPAKREGMVFYGNTYGSKNEVLIASPRKIDGLVCFRNIPCHQSCFYQRKLCTGKSYDLQYRIRADYDHFLWCYYEAGAQMVYMGLTVAAYEGGGYSESRENRKRDRREHREITEKYMSRSELFRYRFLMMLTLAPLRSRLAESKIFAEFYHKLKARIYGR